MNIECHLYAAKVSLKMANTKIAAKDYVSAVLALTKACSHIHELTGHVQILAKRKMNITDSKPRRYGGPY